jgi:uncharacterized small protein (DUF1192 family)
MTRRRDSLIEAAAHAVEEAFVSRYIVNAFRRAGIYPPDPNPVLDNPCVKNAPQEERQRGKRTFVDISKKALFSVADIPSRVALTKADQAERRAATRAKNKAARAQVAAATATAPLAVSGGVNEVETSVETATEGAEEEEDLAVTMLRESSDVFIVDTFAEQGNTSSTPEAHPQPAPEPLSQRRPLLDEGGAAGKRRTNRRKHMLPAKRQKM